LKYLVHYNLLADYHIQNKNNKLLFTKKHATYMVEIVKLYKNYNLHKLFKYDTALVLFKTNWEKACQNALHSMFM